MYFTFLLIINWWLHAVCVWKVIKATSCSGPGCWGKTSSGVKGCCDPSRQYDPPGTYFFVFLETAAQPLTSLSTKPLDLIPNNPTANNPLLLASTVEDHKNVRMPGLTFLKPLWLISAWLAVRTSKDTQYLKSSTQWTVFTSKLLNKLHDITELFSNRPFLLTKRERKKSTNSSVNMFEADVSIIFTSLISTRQLTTKFVLAQVQVSLPACLNLWNGSICDLTMTMTIKGRISSVRTNLLLFLAFKSLLCDIPVKPCPSLLAN